MNLKRCDYTAICKQLFLNHISNFTLQQNPHSILEDSRRVTQLCEGKLYQVVNAKVTPNEVKQVKILKQSQRISS